MDKAFFFEIISNKPELFSAIVEFNCKLLYEVMLKVSDEMTALTIATPGFDVSLNQKLALWAIDLKKDRLVETEYCFWDFGEETRRLALLEPEVIERLELVFGAAIHAEDISKVLKRAEVLKLQQILGEELYQYSLLRGRYQLGTVRRFFLAKEIPLPLSDRIQWDGRLALRICSSSWPTFLQSRFFSQLKMLFLPQEERMSQEYSLPVIKGVWDGLKKILLREVAPQWTPFFD